MDGVSLRMGVVSRRGEGGGASWVGILLRIGGVAREDKDGRSPISPFSFTILRERTTGVSSPRESSVAPSSWLPFSSIMVALLSNGLASGVETLGAGLIAKTELVLKLKSWRNIKSENTLHEPVYSNLLALLGAMAPPS